MISVLSLLVLPQVSFAAWYNPFTWFKKPVAETTRPINSVQTSPTSIVLYTKSTTNVRECPSLDCKVLFTLPLNNRTVFPANFDIKQSWYHITFYAEQDESGNFKSGTRDVVGYVSSSLFSQNQVSVNRAEIKTTPKIPTPSPIPTVNTEVLNKLLKNSTFSPTPTPLHRTTISETRNASAFLIKELVGFNGEIDTRTRELNDVIRQNYADFGYVAGVYIITRNFELEIGQYTTRWETMKRDNNNALLKLNTITDVDQYLAVAKVTGALLLVSKEQFYRNLGYTKILIQRYAQDIKATMEQDLQNLNNQLTIPEPTPSPTYIYIPPTEPAICQKIRDDPDYSKSLKQTKLAYWGCY